MYDDEAVSNYRFVAVATEIICIHTSSNNAAASYDSRTHPMFHLSDPLLLIIMTL